MSLKNLCFVFWDETLVRALSALWRRQDTCGTLSLREPVRQVRLAHLNIQPLPTKDIFWKLSEAQTRKCVKQEIIKFCSLTRPLGPDYVQAKNSQRRNKINWYRIGRIDPDIKEKLWSSLLKIVTKIHKRGGTASTSFSSTLIFVTQQTHLILFIFILKVNDNNILKFKVIVPIVIVQIVQQTDFEAMSSVILISILKW